MPRERNWRRRRRRQLSSGRNWKACVREQEARLDHARIKAEEALANATKSALEGRQHAEAALAALRTDVDEKERRRLEIEEAAAKQEAELRSTIRELEERFDRLSQDKEGETQQLRLQLDDSRRLAAEAAEKLTRALAESEQRADTQLRQKNEESERAQAARDHELQQLQQRMEELQKRADEAEAARQASEEEKQRKAAALDEARLREATEAEQARERIAALTREKEDALKRADDERQQRENKCEREKM